MLRVPLTMLVAAMLSVSGIVSSASAVTTATSGTTVTNTYGYTGATETFTVPATVTSITLSATGAEGGRGGYDAAGTAPAGGYQGVVSGTFAVTSGQVLTIAVGKGGANSPDWASCTAGSNYPTGDPNDAVGGSNPLGSYAGGAGGSPGPSGCSGYGGSGGAASVVEIGTSVAPNSTATIVAGGSGGSGGSGQFSPTLGQISLPTFLSRPDATSTSGQDGQSVYSSCHQVSGQQCDGGGGAGGGGGAQGGSQGLVEFGSGTSDEWFGLGGYPGQSLSAGYNYYSDDNANGAVVLSYSTGVPTSPTSVVGSPGNSSVSLYWTAPGSTGDTAVSNYVVQYSNSPYSSWTTASGCSGTSTSCVVTGLTNGTAYEFQVAAVNSIGQGTFSSSSSPVTPSGPPGAPSITSIVPSDGSLSVAFAASSSSLPILDYEYSVDGGATWTSSGVTSSPLVISGLTNGTTYSVEIEGVSSSGAGAASTPTPGTPSALPGAPTITAINPGGDGTTLSLSFVPGYTGGSPITSYQYATSVGANTTTFGSWTSAIGTASPLTVSGLTSGTTYSVELRAVNVKGSGPGSVFVNGVTLTVPDAPTISSIVAGNSTLAVTYAPFTSGNDGGSAISGVEYSLDNGVTWSNAGTLADPFTISSLSNGTIYSVELRADNGVGTGPASFAASGTPFTVPGAPTQVQAVGGPTSATISWSVPTSNGGSVVTGYVASAYAGATGGSATSSCATSTLTCPITGLANDTTYYVSVGAVNAAGSGVASSPRVAVMPVALPGAPTLTGITAGNTDLQVTFTAGSSDINAPVTSYQYSTDGGFTWRSALGATSPITMSGLTNGTSYSVQLRALSVAGAGAASNSENGIPYAAPDSTNSATTTYVAGSGQVSVTWIAPNNNGAAIASYTVTAFTAAVSGTSASTCTTSTLSCTLSGLANGTTYYVSIQSVNVYGEYSLRSTRIPVVPGATSLVSLVANPTSSTHGGSVTLSATLTTGATGTVNFEAGGSSISSCGAVAIVSSSAQCVTNSLPVATSALTATYSGDSHYASSVSATTNFTVSPADQAALTLTPTTTTYVASPGNGAVLATSGGTTFGVVSYTVSSSGNTAGCSVSAATLTYTGTGTCTITASMAGNLNYNVVSSPATSFAVTKSLSSTTLSPTPASSTYGGSVTLTATLTPGVTGTVNFEVDGSTIGSCGAVALISGEAQCVTTDLHTGSGQSLRAVYSGDGNFLTSTSSVVLFSVATATQAPLFVTPLAQITGNDLTLATSGGSGGGAVSYVVSNGTAACSQPSPGVLRTTGSGTCIVTATKATDMNFASISSAPTTVTFSSTQLVTFTSHVPADVYANSSFQPVAVSSSGLAVVISIDISSASVCAFTGSQVNFFSAGICTIDANQSGDATHVAAPQAQQIIDVRLSPPPTGNGTGPSTGSGTGTGTGTPASSPLGVLVSIDGTSADIAWSIPASDGGSTVTSYVVTSSPTGLTCTATNAMSCEITGLKPGTAYSFSVHALNSSGPSSPGASPATSALAPPTLTVFDHVGVVHWKAPPSTVLGHVVGYVVTIGPGDRTCTTKGATTCTVSNVPSASHYTVQVAVIGTAGTTIISANGRWTAPVLRNVYFAFNSYALTKSDRHTLAKISSTVVVYKIHQLRLAGHTDDVGSRAFNVQLSAERARAIAAYLLSEVRRHGYSSLRIRVVADGISRGSANKARDRSVTITS